MAASADAQTNPHRGRRRLRPARPAPRDNAKNGWSLRELYKTLETPGENKLRDAQDALDTAVRAAYGMKPAEDILAFLLKLNLELADKEKKGDPVTPPGLPASIEKPEQFVTEDCVKLA